MELSINWNNITESGALGLAKGLTKAYALKIIRVDGNPIGPCGAVAMLDALAAVSTMPMNEISFSECGIGDHGAEAAGKLIMRRGCTEFFFDGNEINARGAKVIADSINSSAGMMISTLCLYRNNFGDKEITYLLNQITRKNESACELYIRI